ncbi:hypothetical protein BZA70DRAFT_283443 [Myxozyma melibiosi]|uniref:Uncharacterized protein n=1 Tax=Myxozyma melibiosi TaxID=54550 RepID=A0ABR1F0H0_9ASCO
MATTPPRFTSDAADDFGIATPATPKHGPKFDPDCYTIRDRRRKEQHAAAAAASGDHKPTELWTTKDSWQSKPDCADEAEAEELAAPTPNSRGSRLRTRTRTISGPQPGAPMLTPRETPDARRQRRAQQHHQFEQALTTPKEVSSALEVDSEDEELFPTFPTASKSKSATRSAARILFPTATSSKTTPSFKVYEDEEEILPQRSSKIPVFRDADVFDDPFNSSFVASKKRCRAIPDRQTESPDCLPSKKGMMFVFRGKKVFRPFDEEGDLSDDELAVAPIKPRILFPEAQKKAKELSGDPDDRSPTLPSSSSSIFDDGLTSQESDFSPATSQLGSSSMILQEKLGVSRGRRSSSSRSLRSGRSFAIASSDDGESFVTASQTSVYMDNPEEEETDIDESYCSP